jgi:hypothetical protein
MGREYDTYEGEERCIQVLVRKTEGKRSVGRPSRRWEDNIKIDLKEISWEEVK